MTEEEVAGGLDEPGGLQPTQGALRLADPDDTWSRADWEKAAAAVLRKSRRLTEGDPDHEVWHVLARTTYDDVAIPVLGTPSDPGTVSPVRPTRTGPWDVRTYAGAGSEAQVNTELLTDLEGGATSVWVGIRGQVELPVLLHDVRLDLAPVVLGAREDQEAVARAFLDHAGAVLHPGTNLGLDAAQATAALVDLARGAGVLGFVVDADTVHRAGASEAQELGWAMATGAAYLRSLEVAGVSPGEAAGLVEFRFAATDAQLPTIAKLRAARLLWARVLELCGTEPVPMRLHAVTSAPMLTRFDPWVNMLRGTVAAFSAGVGGADAITVLPFDSRLGRPDAFGRRIARNVSHLLVAESHVAAVADPAGGAYAVERLTDDLAAAAWAELQRIEEDGAQRFTARVQEVSRRRRDDVAHRRSPITGVSAFPHLGEALPERPDDGEYAEVPSYAADFEALRSSAPSEHVFLATLGPVAEHTSRTGAATNLLAAGGVAVDVAGETEGVGDLLEAYDGQKVVCLAGTDAAYAEWGSQAVEALRAAGAVRLVVVSPDSTGTPNWADDTCAAGDDAVAFLARVQEVMR